VTDAVYVPIQAVQHQGPQAFVYVRQGSGYAQRAVTVGRSSELNWEVLEGLEVGERVLLREPDPAEVVSKLNLPPVQEDAVAEEDALAGAPPGAVMPGVPAVPGGGPVGASASPGNGPGAGRGNMDP
jgi:hypothetical protein